MHPVGISFIATSRMPSVYERLLHWLNSLRLPIMLLSLAIVSFLFAVFRDLVASGVPDSQAIPLFTYPGFLVSEPYYRSWLLTGDKWPILLFGISSSFLVFIGGMVVLLSHRVGEPELFTNPMLVG